MRCLQVLSHHSSLFNGCLPAPRITPAPSVAPDDQIGLALLSSTLNSRKARRKPTPEGNLCPTLLLTVTRALSSSGVLRTSATVTDAVRFTACSIMAPSAVGME